MTSASKVLMLFEKQIHPFFQIKDLTWLTAYSMLSGSGELWGSSRQGVSQVSGVNGPYKFQWELKNLHQIWAFCYARCRRNVALYHGYKLHFCSTFMLVLSEAISFKNQRSALWFNLLSIYDIHNLMILFHSRVTSDMQTYIYPIYRFKVFSPLSPNARQSMQHHNILLYLIRISSTEL